MGLSLTLFPTIMEVTRGVPQRNSLLASMTVGGRVLGRVGMKNELFGIGNHQLDGLEAL